ncbi:MAG: hypothetical protein IKF46_07385 [Erysipelotrichaceae bacterium]|nr:hypothetical protein [Erysipelotrichaceae bacterium]
MGQYFIWLNPVKGQYFGGPDFDLGAKRRETAYVGCPVLDALYTLMANEWKGDPIVWIGDDYAHLYRETNPALKTTEEICGDRPYDHAHTHFIDIAMDFEKSDREWSVDTYNQFQLEYLKLTKEEKDRYFRAGGVEEGVEFFDPDWERRSEIIELLAKKGFYSRKSEYYRYIINHSKKEFIDRETIKPNVYNSRYDPFPALMIKEDDSEKPWSKGSDNYCGSWLGDDIVVSNDHSDVPGDYEDASNKYTWEDGR